MGKHFLLAAILLITLLSGCVNEDQTAACFEDKCFIVEVADNPREIVTGLMNREYLERDKGMLFVFDHEDEHGFWMKNMKIPLDIIWINSKGEVVFISKEIQPCIDTCPTIKPDKKAKYVLEVNGGLSDEMGLSLGDEIQINNL